jgi:hypothetical protein
MALFGTKACDDSAHDWECDTLGQIYRNMYKEFDQEIWKPKPGDTYRKRFKPLSPRTDYPSFRRAPSDIVIVQPPRLFRTVGWKYKGRTYIDCETSWEFQFRFYNPKYENFGKTPIVQYDKLTGYLEYNRGWQYSWLPIYCLTNYYISSSITCAKQQLSLPLY